MATSPVPPVTCPYCRAPASGRFCSNCGKALDEESSEHHIWKDAIGLKPPPWRAMLATAWLAVAQPAELSRRWRAGERWGLVSPLVMMSTVTAVTALVGVLLSGVFHPVAAPGDDDAKNMGQVLHVYPWLKSRYPVQFAQAALDPEAFGTKMKQLGTRLAVFAPLLFLLPGYLALAPWRRASRHEALIFACVEAIFLLILSGLYLSLTIALPGFAAGGLVGLLFWAAICAHTAVHVRRMTGAGWGYAVSRPFLAAILYLAVIYVWMGVVAALTLLFLPVLTG